MQQWQLQEAKAKFSEVINKAVTQGPQNITVRGESKAVVISIDEYEKLTKNKKTFLQLMRQSPLVGVDFKVTRDKSTTRDTDL
ncbi:MAG: type II toxin-antitoxin system Phd/YefM family antitoxin [Coxiellaceae bacterium]|nr:type II toxin-antitoxin system Phd/YefM family antitoxin [Coxiellaceae bacterium]